MLRQKLSVRTASQGSFRSLARLGELIFKRSYLPIGVFAGLVVAYYVWSLVTGKSRDATPDAGSNGEDPRGEQQHDERSRPTSPCISATEVALSPGEPSPDPSIVVVEASDAVPTTLTNPENCTATTQGLIPYGRDVDSAIIDKSLNRMTREHTILEAARREELESFYLSQQVDPVELFKRELENIREEWKGKSAVK